MSTRRRGADRTAAGAATDRVDPVVGRLGHDERRRRERELAGRDVPALGRRLPHAVAPDRAGPRVRRAAATACSSRSQETATSVATTSFAEPAHDPYRRRSRASLAPVTSTNGTSWQALPELVGDLLPLGVDAGYAREPGRLDRDRDPERRALRAPARHDAAAGPGTRSPATSRTARSSSAGRAVHRPGRVCRRLPGHAHQRSRCSRSPGETVVALRAFHPDAPSVYRVRAIDAAGNVERALAAAGRPALETARLAVPDALPAWAWQLFTWQQQGQIGAAPAGARAAPALVLAVAGVARLALPPAGLNPASR